MQEPPLERPFRGPRAPAPPRRPERAAGGDAEEPERNSAPDGQAGEDPEERQAVEVVEAPVSAREATSINRESIEESPVDGVGGTKPKQEGIPMCSATSRVRCGPGRGL